LAWSFGLTFVGRITFILRIVQHINGIERLGVTGYGGLG
jgi:hypothetical protein